MVNFWAQPECSRNIKLKVLEININNNNYSSISNMTNIPISDLINGYENYRNQIEDIQIEIDTSEEDFRHLEFNAIINEETSSELLLQKCNVDEYPGLGKYFENITLVHRLRETTAYCGFTRVNPPNGDEIQQRKLELRKNPYVVRNDDKWLPAIWVCYNYRTSNFNKTVKWQNYIKI